MALARIDNRAARRLFLDRHALAEQPTGPAKGADLLALIKRLGFVQVDSVNTVERAHHMILWARRQSYRPKNLKPLLERDRVLFEHWTHDASVIPTEFLPHWHHRFAHNFVTIPERWKDWQGTAFHEKVDDVLTRIRERGAVSTTDVGEDEARSSGGWWDWNPTKAALEYLWHSGRLAVCHRDGFTKHYDLAERVYPVCHAPSRAETVDWACRAALDRLGFATSGEIAAFWNKVTPEEAKEWCAAALRRKEIEEVLVECADGAARRSFAFPGLAESAATAPEPPDRLRVLSPFDPALRDRKRAVRLFDFDYRIEIFVPAAKRRYGYYVFPLLEGDKLVGRIDMKCARSDELLVISALWPEKGIRFGKGRLTRLEAELERLGRFTGCPTLRFQEGWLRDEKVL
ncbi:MAG: crosslink repair DNA glycosylase YcaQ family protein [Paracoccaceae bacterium]